MEQHESNKEWLGERIQLSGEELLNVPPTHIDKQWTNQKVSSGDEREWDVLVR